MLFISSISLPDPFVAMNDTTGSERLATIIRVLQSIGPASGVSRNLVEQHITLARSAIRSLDQQSLLQRVARLDDQIHIITRLQDLAYYDPDSGGVPDIAQWCVRQWLRLLQQHAEHVDVLRGSYHILSTAFGDL